MRQSCWFTDTRLFRLILNLKYLNFPHNVNYVNTLEINVRQISPFSVSMVKMALDPTLAQGVKPHEHRRRPPTIIEKNVQQRNCKGTRVPCPPSHPLLPWATVLSGQDTPCRRTSLGRSRSTTPGFRRSSLGVCCWEGPISHSSVPVFGRVVFHLSEPRSLTAKTSIFDNLPTMISAAISAIDFTLDIFFLFILSKYPNSPPLPFMRLKAHGSFGQTFDGQTASLRRATESLPLSSTCFALAAQHVKFTKIQHYSCGWECFCCIEMNFMKSEIQYKRMHCDRPYSQNSWNSTINERPYCKKPSQSDWQRIFSSTSIIFQLCRAKLYLLRFLREVDRCVSLRFFTSLWTLSSASLRSFTIKDAPTVVLIDEFVYGFCDVCVCLCVCLCACLPACACTYVPHVLMWRRLAIQCACM